jgi:hypothetical protein
MPNWSGGVLTTKGQALQAKVDAGQTKLTLTKMKIGSGILPNGQNLQSLNDLVKPEMIVPISAVSAAGNVSTIIGVITNTGVTNGFNVRELGVYAQDPTLGEILYSITTDSAPDYLPPEGGAVTVSSEFSYNIVVSNAANVTAVLNPNGLVTVSILQQHKDAATLDHPDNSVTDAKIGTRSITDTTAPAGTAGTLTTLLGRIGNMIKSITGKSNWYTAPATTLEAANTHANATGLQHGATGANTALAIVARDANGNFSAGTITADLNGKATKLATARKINTVPFDGSADINLTPANIGAAPDGYGLGGISKVVTDFYSITASGFYRGNKALNAPPASNVEWITVMANVIEDSSAITLIAQSYAPSDAGKVWTCSKYGGTWSAWKQLATMDLVSGYGLGSYCKKITDANTAVLSGFYAIPGFNAGGLNIPVATANAYSYLFVESIDDVNTKQTLFSRENSLTYVRHMMVNKWTEWKQIATTDNYYDKATSDSNYLPRSTTVATGDWNNYVNNGVAYGLNLANAPTSGPTSWYWVQTIRYADNYVYQQAHGFGGSSQVSWERTQNLGVWSPWKQIATTDQIPIADDLSRRFCGRNTPVMTPLMDWSTMAAKANVSSVKNLNNTGTGISAYGGDNKGSLGNGDIYLKQSYKNFDAILVVGCNDPTDFPMTYKWEKWELEFMFNQQYRLNLFNDGSYCGYWNVWCSKVAGASHPQSTETIWYCEQQNCGMIEIYGLNY